MKTLQNQKGITLVAIVVTIIVLIVLAGVSITMLFSENGIITRATQGRNNYVLAANEEEAQLRDLASKIDNLSGESASINPIYSKL